MIREKTLSGSSGMDASAPDAPEQLWIEPTLTLALAQASIAAYADYDRKTIVPPADYTCVARWTGWVEGIGFGKEERFGLLFRSTLAGQEGTFIFAFRGTDSDMDLFPDLFFEPTEFSPYRGAVSPTPCVSSGFYGVYNALGGAMTQSMREQLFSLLAQHQPGKVYLTGHSLGAALSQLFALDVAVSTPDLWAANLNFASPKVGVESWKIAYDAQAAQKDPARETIRVINYWDYVPAMPPSWFGYEHVGREFRTAFFVQGALLPHFLARHSMLNLQTVLGNAVCLDPQVWCGTFQDATDPRFWMQSEAPPGGAQPAWADRLRELQRFEQHLREGTAA